MEDASDPKRPQLELDGIEWARTDARSTFVLGERLQTASFKSQCLERSPQRVDEPGVRHAFARVDAQLLAAIDGFRRRRQHLANPIRRERHVRLIGCRREALPPPAGQIRHDDVVAEVQLRLDEQQPAARTSNWVIVRCGVVLARKLCERAVACDVVIGGRQVDFDLGAQNTLRHGVRKRFQLFEQRAQQAHLVTSSESPNLLLDVGKSSHRVQSLTPSAFRESSSNLAERT